MANVVNFMDKIIPNHTGQKQPPCWKKIVFMFFPRFNMKKFTFWFGLSWFTINFIMILQARTFKVDGIVRADCIFVRWGAAVTPYIRFKHHLHRIIIGPLMCEDTGQLIIGLYIIWSYGFLYEHYLTKCQILTTVIGSTIISSLIGCFIEFQRVRCSGTVVIAAWGSLYIFLLWDRLEYNVVLRLVKLVMYIVKMMVLLTVSLKQYSDPIATCCAFAFGVLLALSFIKEIGPNVNEERKFILLRLKIFIFIVSLMILLMCFAYACFMYDKKKQLTLLESDYVCQDKVEKKRILMRMFGF